MPRGFTEVQYGTQEELERLLRGEVNVPLIASAKDAPVYPEGLLDEEYVESRPAPGYHLHDESVQDAFDPAKGHEVMDRINWLRHLLEIHPAIASDPDFRMMVAEVCDCAEMVRDVLAIIEPRAEIMVRDMARQLQLEF